MKLLNQLDYWWLFPFWLSVKRSPSWTEFSTYRCVLNDEARVTDYSMGLLDAMMFFSVSLTHWMAYIIRSSVFFDRRFFSSGNAVNDLMIVEHRISFAWTIFYKSKKFAIRSYDFFTFIRINLFLWLQIFTAKLVWLALNLFAFLLSIFIFAVGTGWRACIYSVFDFPFSSRSALANQFSFFSGRGFIELRWREIRIGAVIRIK